MTDALSRPGEPARFEGSYLGDRARLPANARLECKICWWVYDPAEGDVQWQIPPGTPFHALPAHWRCPQCAINRGDGVPDTYITCPKAGGTACNHNDMFHVVSARLHVLARNLEPTPGHQDTKTYVLAGTTYGPFNDGFIRRTYSTSVRLMNRAGRREP